MLMRRYAEAAALRDQLKPLEEQSRAAEAQWQCLAAEPRFALGQVGAGRRPGPGGKLTLQSLVELGRTCRCRCMAAPFGLEAAARWAGRACPRSSLALPQQMRRSPRPHCGRCPHTCMLPCLLTGGVAQVVVHASKGYRGVVCGWDGFCCESEEWRARAGVR